MIIELVGLPASGKTYLTNKCCEKLGNDILVFLDNEWNKKTKFNKALFLLTNIFLLFDKRFFRINRLIKATQEDEYHKSFYLKQFRLDFVLSKRAIRMSRNKIVVFSENLINLSYYIFFRKGLKTISMNTDYFLQYVNMLQQDLLKRDLIIHIDVKKQDLILYQKARKGVFEQANPELGFQWSKEALPFVLKQMGGCYKSLITITNDYTDGSVDCLCDILKKTLKDFNR